MERTLVLLKPDAIQRGLVGEITSRFEKKGLKMIGVKMMSLDEAVLREHYAHIADKPFFPGVEKFMKSSPVLAMCWEGLEAVNAVRLITGITKAREADAGTIRGDFAMSVSCNVI
ncbi:MAG: nucleoside-diphosphate kinase, partial [Patescibacteria group bacterium]